jgi:DnaJ homolog subfamily C member 13
MRESALEYLSVDLQMAREALALDDFQLTRLGLCRCLFIPQPITNIHPHLILISKDEQLTSYAEFKVQKHSTRTAMAAQRTQQSDGPQLVGTSRRLLCLSESCIIERDPVSYAVICARPLRTVGVGWTS